MNPRPDDPEKVMKHAGRYDGKTALVVLGGYSAVGWEALRDKIKPDLIIGGNGVNSMVHNLTYWACCENMTPWATKEDPRSISLMQMFYRDTGAKIRLISHRSWHLLKDTTNCIRIMRDKNHGDGPGETPDYFSFRKYGGGLLNGWLLKNKAANMELHVGTVGVQLLHVAGILGCAVVHTIGYDLMFKDDQHHHWYEYPRYEVDTFRKPSMFIEYLGVKTQWIWVETAQFLKAIQPLFIRDGLNWFDHSAGLLQVMNVV